MTMREALAQYHGKRIKVTGIFDRFGCEGEASGQTVLIQDLHTDGTPLCDHCWVQKAENFLPLDLKRGDLGQFIAAVLSYKKQLRFVQEDGTSYRVEYSLY